MASPHGIDGRSPNAGQSLGTSGRAAVSHVVATAISWRRRTRTPRDASLTTAGKREPSIGAAPSAWCARAGRTGASRWYTPRAWRRGCIHRDLVGGWLPSRTLPRSLRPALWASLLVGGIRISQHPQPADSGSKNEYLPWTFRWCRTKGDRRAMSSLSTGTPWARRCSRAALM